jgi:1-deoxy-D-xylulose-5-phosphate reductoisomerase
MVLGPILNLPFLPHFFTPHHAPKMKQIAVLGSTGSIGTSCLDVVRSLSDRLSIFALTAHANAQLLAEQSQVFSPRFAVLSGLDAGTLPDRPAFPQTTELLWGAEAIEQVAAMPEVDVVVSGIVGAAGLRGTWAAIEAGKTVAIANKETLVVAGPLVMEKAAQTGATLIPVDSEHSAVFQALQAGQPREVRRVVLTASGGPFRGWTLDQMRNVTPEMALDHPTWNMGPKITIDSATMLNKALEVIEAKWLFGLDADQIEVVVHPQSIIHSFVEFVDGSVIAQLSPPDMKLPIQYALTWPERVPGTSPAMDWTQSHLLELSPPDLDAFPGLKLGFDVARRGGSSGAVLNAAKESAVERFLNHEISFIDIPRACKAVLEAHEFDPSPTLSDLIRLDGWARKETTRWQA